MPVPAVRPQPMLSVVDVAKSSTWYQEVLGASSGDGGEYEQLLVDGVLILQLHRLEVGHHHGTIGDPERPTGNGVAVWFEIDEFDTAVSRSRAGSCDGLDVPAGEPHRQGHVELAPA